MTPEALQRRQQQLLIRSTELRQVLVRDVNRLQHPASLVDQVTVGWRWVAQHPQWPLAVLAVLLVLKPKRALSWSAKLWWLWKSARQLRRLRQTLQPFLAPR